MAISCQNISAYAVPEIKIEGNDLVIGITKFEFEVNKRYAEAFSGNVRPEEISPQTALNLIQGVPDKNAEKIAKQNINKVFFWAFPIKSNYKCEIVSFRSDGGVINKSVRLDYTDAQPDWSQEMILRIIPLYLILIFALRNIPKNKMHKNLPIFFSIYILVIFLSISGIIIMGNFFGEEYAFASLWFFCFLSMVILHFFAMFLSKHKCLPKSGELMIIFLSLLSIVPAGVLTLFTSWKNIPLTECLIFLTATCLFCYIFALLHYNREQKKLKAAVLKGCL